MITNSPVKLQPPLELTMLKYLQPRMHFSSTEKRRLYNLQRGYEGEQKLYSILKENLSPNYLILNDILLKSDLTEFQIDLLLIGSDTVYPLEVKNYEGDYIVQNENWYTVATRTEIRNPLHQLQRNEVLLQQFLTQHKCNFSVKSYIVFVNEGFSLYQASLDAPIIFPTQINRFIKNLRPISFNSATRQQELTELLTAQDLVTSSLQKHPNYRYEELHKGIVCATCRRFLDIFNKTNLICKSCNQRESMESAITRNVKEFMMLFPNKKVTTKSIHEWCRIIKSQKTIRRILNKQMKKVGKTKGVHFVKK